MISPCFAAAARPDTISTLYGTIVAQARLPAFIATTRSPILLMAVLSCIVLHLAMVFDRLAEDPALQKLGQGIFDRFCQDMDHNLREMGVGDLSVPKEMQRMGEAFYGRAQAYRSALAAADEGALVEALTRNIYERAPTSGAAAPVLRPMCGKRYVISGPSNRQTCWRASFVSDPEILFVE